MFRSNKYTAPFKSLQYASQTKTQCLKHVLVFACTMSAALRIEPVKKSTFSDFLHLLTQLANYEHQPPPDHAAQHRLKEDCFTPHPPFHVYLAYHNTEPIGYLIVYYTYSSFLARPTLYIEDLFIHPHYRRKGYGQQLFDFCLTIANEQKCGRMQWNVYEWNAPAIQLYEKNNATQLDKRLYQITLN